MDCVHIKLTCSERSPNLLAFGRLLGITLPRKLKNTVTRSYPNRWTTASTCNMFGGRLGGCSLQSWLARS